MPAINTSYALRMGINLTGSTTMAVINLRNTVQSDVTGEVDGYYSQLQTAVAAFTLTTLNHFHVAATTLGAGSAITNQFGFVVDSGMTQGTNNFAFSSNIASGSNRWNLYMNGTAANYFAGQTTVGSTSLTLGSGSVAQQFGVVSTAATTVSAVIRGAASQTADIIQYQNSSGTVLGGANALAQTYTGSTSPILVATGGATTAASGDGTTATITTTSAHGLAVGDLVTVAGVTPTGYNGTFLVTAVGTNTVSYLNATTGTQTVAGTVSAPAQASVTSRSAGTVGLVVKSAASQTADLQEWQNSSGTILARITSVGDLDFPSSSSATIRNAGNSSMIWQPGTGWRFSSYGSANVPLIARGLASQTGDLQQFQNSSAAVIGGFNAAGQLYAGTTASVVGSTTTALTSAAYTSATVAVFTYGGTSLVQAGQRVTVAGVTGGAYNGTWTVSAVTSTTFTVLGSGFTNNAGSGGTFQLSAVGSFVAGTAAITPLVVQAAASQTANLQEWQNSAGTVLASIIASGSIRGFAGLYGTNSANSAVNALFVVNSVAANTVAVIKGAASQTANLQEWQNSAGTVLTSILAAGTINFASGNTSATATAGAITAPALVTGFITMQIAGTTVKVPYYSN